MTLQIYTKDDHKIMVENSILPLLGNESSNLGFLSPFVLSLEIFDTFSHDL